MRRRADDLGRRDLGIQVLTPESAPLADFEDGSAAVAKVLMARRIDLRTSVSVTEEPGGVLTAGETLLKAGAVIALPVIEGPRSPACRAMRPASSPSMSIAASMV